MKMILAFDPSGAFNEGKGTTGWCLLNQETKEAMDVGSIAAGDYPTDMQYFAANIDVLRYMYRRYTSDLSVVIEDYLLYGQYAAAQTNSRMETSQLIGALRYQAFLLDAPVRMQPASLVVNRWCDQVLIAKGLLNTDNRLASIPELSLNPHEKDAFRHAYHFATFGSKTPKEGEDNGVPNTDPAALRCGTRSRSGFIPRGFCFAEKDGAGSN